MSRQITSQPRIGRFFSLVILLSLPFWLLGAYTGNTSLLPANLPIGALMAICPILAVVILIAWDKSRGLRAYSLNLQMQSKNRIWYIIALLGMPAVTVVCYLIMNFFEMPLPSSTQIVWTDLLFLLPLFLLGAIGEETGWTAYILRPLKTRFGLVRAVLLLAIFGALWHSVPLLQGGNGVEWILWQCAVIFMTRLLTVGLYFASGQSLLAVILFHVMDNVSFAMFPNGGSHYNPAIKAVVLAAVLLFIGVSFLMARASYNAKHE